MINIQHVRWGY